MKLRLIGFGMACTLLLSLAACAQTADAPQSQAQGSAAQTYTGTVRAISEQEISIDTQDGETVTFPLSEDTSFERGRGAMNQTPPEIPDGQTADSQTPPEMPDGQAADGQTPPEMPDGQAADGQTPPEMPDGQAADGQTPPEMPDGQTADGQTPPEQSGDTGNAAPALTYQDVAVGDEVTISVDDDGVVRSVLLSAGMPAGMGGPGGQSAEPDSYAASNEYTQDTTVDDATLASTEVDENAVLVATDSITATLNRVAITRESDESTGGDASSFYGVGAAALATDGTLVIADSTIHTDAAGGAGVFAYQDGTAYVSDTEITTERDTSGGIHVAGGGTLYAWDLTVETAGESSAAIRSDRGSGTMVIDGGSYTSHGEGSPAVYSTADITVHSAKLQATGSEAVCIEGMNTLRLFDCTLRGNMSDLPQNDSTWNVILYQSMSGDSQEGNSTFEMVGGSLCADNGGMFYTTNTESTFILSDVDITNTADSEFLLKCTGNSNQRGWGTAGENGADCTFTAIRQQLEGTVVWDSISCLNFYLTQGSSLTGAVVQDESNAGAGGDGYACLYLDESSTWIVTGDSFVTQLQCAGSIVDANGNAVSIVGTDGTVYVSGESEYTITVEQYFAQVDISGASALDQWEDYAVERD